MNENAMAVMFTDADFPSTVAVRIADPVLTEVIFPSRSTVAFALSLAHVIVFPLIAAPAASRGVAWIEIDCPFASVAVVRLKRTEATTGTVGGGGGGGVVIPESPPPEHERHTS